LLDTPHFATGGIALGRIETRMIEGACYAVDPNTHKAISEQERILDLLGQDILEAKFEKRFPSMAWPRETLKM
jgi:hypothetical protein